MTSVEDLAGRAEPTTMPYLGWDAEDPAVALGITGDEALARTNDAGSTQ